MQPCSRCIPETPRCCQVRASHPVERIGGGLGQAGIHDLLEITETKIDSTEWMGSHRSPEASYPNWSSPGGCKILRRARGAMVRAESCGQASGTCCPGTSIRGAWFGGGKCSRYADPAILVHVGVIELAGDGHRGRHARIVLRELELSLEHPALAATGQTAHGGGGTVVRPRYALPTTRGHGLTCSRADARVRGARHAQSRLHVRCAVGSEGKEAMRADVTTMPMCEALACCARAAASHEGRDGAKHGR